MTNGGRPALVNEPEIYRKFPNTCVGGSWHTHSSCLTSSVRASTDARFSTCAFAPAFILFMYERLLHCFICRPHTHTHTAASGVCGGLVAKDKAVCMNEKQSYDPHTHSYHHLCMKNRIRGKFGWGLLQHERRIAKIPRNVQF